MAIDIVALHQSLIRELTEFTELLQRELEENREMTTARANNFYLLQLVLEEPELQLRDYDTILFKKYEVGKNADIQKQLRVSKLITSENRLRLARLMKETSSKTFNL